MRAVKADYFSFAPSIRHTNTYRRNRRRLADLPCHRTITPPIMHRYSPLARYYIAHTHFEAYHRAPRLRCRSYAQLRSRRQKQPRFLRQGFTQCKQARHARSLPPLDIHALKRDDDYCRRCAAFNAAFRYMGAMAFSPRGRADFGTAGHATCNAHAVPPDVDMAHFHRVMMAAPSHAAPR